MSCIYIYIYSTDHLSLRSFRQGYRPLTGGNTRSRSTPSSLVPQNRSSHQEEGLYEAMQRQRVEQENTRKGLSILMSSLLQ